MGLVQPLINRIRLRLETYDHQDDPKLDDPPSIVILVTLLPFLGGRLSVVHLRTSYICKPPKKMDSTTIVLSDCSASFVINHS